VRGGYMGGDQVTFYLNEDLGTNGLSIMVVGRWF
ncbi:phage tail protein, partial [Pseudomonas aeruginosa]